MTRSNLFVGRATRRTTRLLPALLAGILVSACFVSERAEASTSTSYVTANLAGADSYWGISHQQRVANLSTILYTVAAGHPSGIAVQEVCEFSGTQPVSDSLDTLIFQWNTVQHAYVFAAVPTGKIQGSCVQYNAVFATGNYHADAALKLPGDGTSEDRYAVCLVAHGYVYTTTCSTHITKRVTSQTDYRTAQANAARNFFAYIATTSPSSFGAWLVP